MAFHSSVPFLVMSVVIVLSGIAADRLIASGFHELRVRKTFIAVGFAIALAIVPAGLVEDNGTSVWLLMLSLCGLGVALAEYVEHYAGVLHEASRGHRLGDPELRRKRRRYHCPLADRGHCAPNRVICAGLRFVRIPARRRHVRLLVSDERQSRRRRRSLSPLAPSSLCPLQRHHLKQACDDPLPAVENCPGVPGREEGEREGGGGRRGREGREQWRRRPDRDSKRLNLVQQQLVLAVLSGCAQKTTRSIQ